MADKAFPLAEQFVSAEQQRESAELGMWVFLATEILFFGCLFLALIVYRTIFPAIFNDASKHLNVTIGAINTFILLTSSLAMALSIENIKEGNVKKTFRFLIVTALLGVTFLGFKAVEYHDDYTQGLFLNKNFILSDKSKIFFFLYFFMTLFHTLHLLIGIGIVSMMAWRTSKQEFSKIYFIPVEIAGLYWHFVDIIWVFLFPLLYLGGRGR